MKTFTLSTCKPICLAATASLAVVALASSALDLLSHDSRATQASSISKTSGRAPAGSSGSSSQLTGGGTSPGNPGVRSLAVAPTASHGAIVLGGSGGGTGSGGSTTYDEQVFIGLGSFDMGAHVWVPGGGPGTPSVPDSERPIHPVALSAFRMDKFEVTNRRYVEYLNAALCSGSVHMKQDTVCTPDGAMDGFPLCQLNPSGITFNGTEFQVAQGRRNHPVVNVTWFGACAFANNLSLRRGLTPCYNEIDWSCNHAASGFRLPTEAEWEYAARAKLEYFAFPWVHLGLPVSVHGNQANFLNSGDPYENTSPGTTPVGYFDGNQVVYPLGSPGPLIEDMSNGFGLYDMAGNVQEWCGDWLSYDYYSNSPINNPTGPATALTDPFGPLPLGLRAIRGGSHKARGFDSGYMCSHGGTPHSDLRVANREGGAPSDSNSETGFRLVRTAQMVPIPDGTFEMGRHQGSGQNDELPVRTVTLDTFSMDIFEVSCKEYVSFLNSALANGDVVLNLGDAVCQAANPTLILCDTTQSYSGSNITFDGAVFGVTSGMEDHPMAHVSWFGACAYANALSLQRGLTPCYDETDWSCDTREEGFRLPTESEWEYAARGGEDLRYTIYPFGDTIDGTQANFVSSGDPFALSTPVGYYDGDQVINDIPSGVDMANGFGLYDMSGNVLEWCGDRYGPYSGLPSTNPTGPTTGSARVLRGGSFLHDANNLRSANRESGPPSLRGIIFGFRLVTNTCQ